MRGNIKVVLFLAVTFLGILIQLPIHEYGHYVVGRAFGWDGVILFDHVNFTVVPASVTPEQVLLVRLAGGLIAGTAMLIFTAISKKPYGYGFLPVAITSFAYAPFDGSAGSVVGQILVALVLVGAFLAIGVYLMRAGQFEDDYEIRREEERAS